MALPRPVRIAGEAVKTMGRHILVVLVLCVVVAALRAPIDHFLFASIVGDQKLLGSNSTLLVKYVLADAGLALLTEILVGPLLAAAMVYLARRDYEGLKSSLSGTLSFAAKRYGRLFLPHLAVQISIQVGIQCLIVPGLLFYGMWALIWPVACLEDETWPLDRSKELTRGRRWTIMWLVIPVVTIMLVKGYAWDLQALGEGVLSLAIADILNLLMELFLYTAFAWLYLERVPPERRGAEPAPAVETGPQVTEPPPSSF